MANYWRATTTKKLPVLWTHRRVRRKDVSHGLAGVWLRGRDVAEDGRVVFVPDDAADLVDVMGCHLLLLLNNLGNSRNGVYKLVFDTEIG